MLKFELKGEPPPSKKNQKVMVFIKGKPRLITSVLYRKWHAIALAAVTVQAYEFYTDFLPMSDAKISIKFFPSTRRRQDLTNKAESVLDLLVDAKILEDDNWNVVKSVTLLFGGVDKTNPRTEIEVC